MLNLLQRWYQRHFSQPGTIEFALVLVSAFLIVYYLMWLVGPLVVALCLAFCLDWPVEYLQRVAHIKRRLSVVITMIVFCSLVTFTAILLVPSVIKQGAEFYNSMIVFSLEETGNKQQDEQELARLAAAATEPTLYDDHVLSGPNDANGQNAAGDQNAEASQNLAGSHNTTSNQRFAPSPNYTLPGGNSPSSYDRNLSAGRIRSSEAMPSSQGQGQIALGHVSSLQESVPPQRKIDPWDDVQGTAEHFTMTVQDFDRRLAHEFADIVDTMPEPLPSMVTLPMLEDMVRATRVGASNRIADLIRTQLMPSVVNAFTWMVYFIIVPIFTFLMLYNKHELQKRAKTFLLPNNQVLMRKFWPSLHKQIADYIRGKILHIIIIAIANGLAFMLMGMNYALLLGVGVGLSVVIPYVGAVIIAIPVVLVAVFQFGFSTTLIWVLVIYVVIQLLDSNVLTPMLFSKTLNLDAFSILAAILIFGGLWGFWGVFFAIPLATFIKTLITRWPTTEIKAIRNYRGISPLYDVDGETFTQEARPTTYTELSSTALTQLTASDSKFSSQEASKANASATAASDASASATATIASAAATTTAPGDKATATAAMTAPGDKAAATAATTAPSNSATAATATVAPSNRANSAATLSRSAGAVSTSGVTNTTSLASSAATANSTDTTNTATTTSTPAVASTTEVASTTGTTSATHTVESSKSKSEATTAPGEITGTETTAKASSRDTAQS